MYELFEVTDRWTGEVLHCRWRGNFVAIATRHADAVDIRFDINDRLVWVAMPAPAWVEFKRRTGNVITDRLAAQIAGHFLKTSIDNGYDNGREFYMMSIEEVLEHLDAVMKEAGNSENLPILPVIGDQDDPAQLLPETPATPALES